MAKQKHEFPYGKDFSTLWSHIISLEIYPYNIDLIGFEVEMLEM